MDGETIRLIVVALGAIIAGLSGSLMAGAYNSRNTLAAIEAARVAAETQRETDRDLEHERWLRDRKVEIYSEFLEEVHELELFIAEVRRSSGNDLDALLKNVGALSLLHLRVIAPKHVQEAAAEVELKITATATELVAIKTRLAHDEEAYNSARADFKDKMAVLEQRISEDLGIEGTV